MTAATLLADLRRRGVRLHADGHTLRWRARQGVLSDADRNVLVEYKAAILDLLQAEGVGQPVAPCALCGGTAWTWEPGWHRDHHRRDDHDDHDDVEHHGADHAVHDDHAAGQPEPVRGGWVCHTCIARPVPTLAAVAASLTPAERARLQAEADAGDRLGRMVLSGLRHAAAFSTGERIYAWDVVDDATGTGEATG